MSNHIKGLLLVIISTLIYASIGVFAKWASASALALLCAWMIVGLPVFFVSALVRGRLAISGKDLLYTGIVTALFLTADAAFIASSKMILVSSAMFVKFFFPILIVLVANPLVWRKPILTLHVRSAILGLAGLIIVLRPWDGVDSITRGHLFALGSAICLAFAFTFLKKIDHIPRDTFLGYRYLFGSLILVPIVGFTESAQMLFAAPIIWVLLGFGILYGVIASIIDVTGFVYLDDREVGIIKYIEPPAAIFFAVLFLGEKINPAVLAGGLVIIIGGLLIPYSAMIQKRKAAKRSELRHDIGDRR